MAWIVCYLYVVQVIVGQALYTGIDHEKGSGRNHEPC